MSTATGPGRPGGPAEPGDAHGAPSRGGGARHTPLRLSTEWRRQATRPRTRWILLILAALPLVVVAAFALGDQRGGGPGFDDVATTGAANFTVFMLFVTAELLLLIVGCLFVGDTVASEAGWGSLRYLLTAPVPRARLLTAKLLVGLGWTTLALVGFLAWVLLVGGMAYGWDGLLVPAGGVIGWGSFGWRLVVAAAFILVAQLPFVAIAFWLGVRTDAPLAAVGAGVMSAIISSILDSIDAIGEWRVLLPNHNARAWIGLFGQEVPWGELLHGVLWALLWASVVLALAWRHFERKDVLS